MNEYSNEDFTKKQLFDLEFKYQYLKDTFNNNFWWYSQINWHLLPSIVKLNELFIEEFQNKLNWYDIVRHQKLSEEFILKFKNRIAWNDILHFQNVSNEFIEKYKEIWFKENFKSYVTFRINNNLPIIG